MSMKFLKMEAFPKIHASKVIQLYFANLSHICINDVQKHAPKITLQQSFGFLAFSFLQDRLHEFDHHKML
jgi:hypothetical protein